MTMKILDKTGLGRGGEALPGPRMELRGLRKTFPGVVALDRVDFDLFPGEVHALLGANGAGKSTLIKTVAGVYRPAEGEVLLDGAATDFQTPAEAHAAGIRVIHQDFALVADLSVTDNLFLGHEKTGRLGSLDRRAARDAAEQALAQVGAGISPDERLGRLSIGQQQMVEIARAMIGGVPRVLILDEPTASLSEAESEQLFTLIRKLAGQGVAMIYVSHRLDEIEPLCSRATILRDGRSIGTFATADLDRAALVRHISGETRAVAPRPAADPGATRLDVAGLTLPGRFQDVSFTAKAGETLVLTGLVGAGRSEVVETIFGLRQAASGQVSVDGTPLNDNSPARAIAAGLALVPEDRRGMGLALGLPLSDNIALPSLADFVTRGGLSRSRQQAHAAGQVRELGIKAAATETLCGKLSGGNQQKVVISKWLTTGASVYLLDEPTQGVDVGAKAEIYALIDRLRGEGCAIVAVSSDLEEVLKIADRVIAMQNGRVTGHFTGPEITAAAITAAITHGDIA